MKNSIKIKKVMNILLLTLLLNSCNNETKRLIYYQDFNPITKQGLREIDISKLSGSFYQDSTFYKVIHKNGLIDSLIINNPFGKETKSMKLKVLYNDSVSLYKTYYPYDGGRSYKSYYVFSTNKASRYTYWGEDQWLVVNIGTKKSSGGGKVIDIVDTINFEKKLLMMDSVRMMKMPLHQVEKYTLRLDKNFTFNRWLHDRE